MVVGCCGGCWILIVVVGCGSAWGCWLLVVVGRLNVVKCATDGLFGIVVPYNKMGPEPIFANGSL